MAGFRARTVGGGRGLVAGAGGGSILHAERVYEAGSGRFLSEDPIGLEGGINNVVFAGSDPVGGKDATGLERCIEWWRVELTI